MQNQSSWFIKSLSLHGGVVPTVFPRALVFGILAIGVAVLYRYQPQLPWDFCQYLVNNVAINLILGLLLVFRTNTAYERFWEGRKAWGEIIVNIRNLLRELEGAKMIQDELAPSPSQNLQPQNVQHQAMVWLVALAIATKSHLRRDLKQEQFETLLTHVEFSKLEASVHPPLLILRWLENFNAEQISVESRELLRERFATLTAGITGCERILNTPLPFAYAIFLRQFILIYCFFLPFGLVETLTWGVIPLTIFVSFFLLGVEAIAAEIENPFGEDKNDLPLDELCRKITAEAKEFGILNSQTEPLTEGC